MFPAVVRILASFFATWPTVRCYSLKTTSIFVSVSPVAQNMENWSSLRWRLGGHADKERSSDHHVLAHWLSSVSIRSKIIITAVGVYFEDSV